MGWQMPPLGNRMPAFATPGNMFAITYCCFLFVAKEGSPDILNELNLGTYGIIEASIFPAYTLSI